MNSATRVVAVRAGCRPSRAGPGGPSPSGGAGPGRRVRRPAPAPAPARALTREQRAQALALRWAAAEIERDREVMMVNRRRKARGDPAELYAMGKLAAAEQLCEWAQTIHKRPPLTEREER